MSKKKIIIKCVVGVSFILLCICIVFLRKYIMFNDISKKSNYLNNKYKYCISYVSGNMIKKFWKVGNIYKSETAIMNEESNSDNVISFWYNSDTDECYKIIKEDNSKSYTVDNNAKNEVMLDGTYDTNIIPINKQSLIGKIMYVFDFENSIKLVNYNNEKCYKITQRNGDLYEIRYFNRETGLCVGGESKIQTGVLN